jgi:gas vesicle protein
MRSGKYESSESTVGTAITFLLIGLGVGAAVGMLLAPKAGRQLRKDLRRSYDGVLEAASDWTEEAKSRFDEVVEKGSDLADEIRSEVRSRTKPISDVLRRS